MDFVLPVSKTVNIYGYLLAKDQGEADEVENWERTVKRSMVNNVDSNDIFTRKFTREPDKE